MKRLFDRTRRVKPEDLKRYWPLAVPVIVFVLAYLLLIQPRISARATSRAEARQLEARIAPLQAVVDRAPAERPQDSALREFERRVPVEDRVPDLLEELARVVLLDTDSGEVRDLLIQNGERVDTATIEASGRPRVVPALAERPDPRFTLFPVPLWYTPVTVSFDSTYRRIGDLLWNLRELPTTIEIRTLEMSRFETDVPLIRTRLVVFAYQRAAAPPPTQQTAEMRNGRTGRPGL